MGFSYDFEADLEDPALKNDIKLKPESLAFFEENAKKCFLCRWLLEDYKKNGTFTGVKQTGDLGSYEIFPIRGEINHLWLELHGRPYPFRKKVTKEEQEIERNCYGSPPPVPAAEAAPAPLPAAPEPQGPEGAAPDPGVVRDITKTPISRPKR